MWTCPVCDGQTDDGFNACWTCRTPRNGIPPGTEVLLRVTVSTTPTLQTHSITQYLGPVFGDTILGANVLRDIFASVTDFVGGRSEEYETILQRGRTIAIREMAERAERMGGNAVAGVSLTYESVRDSMLMVCSTGTAVKIVPTTV